MTELQGKLLEIRKRLDNNEKVEPVTVKTLLNWFGGAQRRGAWVVAVIQSKLLGNGLETFPDFRSAYIYSQIEFRRIHFNKTEASKKNSSTITNPPENIAEHDLDELLNIDDPTYRISRLEAANKDLISVKPESTIREAITLMVTNDYSQLPVLHQKKRGLKGVISWRSIGQNLFINKQMTSVKDFMESNYQLIDSETSLFKALPMIIEHDYVLIENKEKEICGIVTASDLSKQFKQLTEPFLLVSEIENHLRQILIKLPIEDLRKGKDERDEDREIEGPENLTFGEYERLFQNPDIWEKLQLAFDKGTFCEYLEKIRSIRNDIMHFDPDGLEENSTEVLRNFVRLLQTFRQLGSI